MKPIYKYCLTEKGLERCRRNEFYLQALPSYKGHTYRIFMLFYHNHNTPLTQREIGEELNLSSSVINGNIGYNIVRGFIKKIKI